MSDVIRYIDDIEAITADQLDGFFVGWPTRPSSERHLAVLRGSDHVVVALDGERVVGFITALTDGVLTAFIPLLEVLPAYRRTGIGTELVRRMLASLEGCYSVDLVCDADVVDFYARLGFVHGVAMMKRTYARLVERPEDAKASDR